MLPEPVNMLPNAASVDYDKSFCDGFAIMVGYAKKIQTVGYIRNTDFVGVIDGFDELTSHIINL